MAATRSQLRSWLLRAVAAVLGAQLLCAPAKAQRIVANPEYDAMFAQVLREPANLDLSFRFAEVATATGDYEAAIGALERMLFYNPALPRARLELRHSLFPPRLLRDGAQLPQGRARRLGRAAGGEGAGRAVPVRDRPPASPRRSGAASASSASASRPTPMPARRARSSAAPASTSVLRPALASSSSRTGTCSVSPPSATSTISTTSAATSGRRTSSATRRASSRSSGSTSELAEIQTGPRLALMPDLWVGSSVTALRARQRRDARQQLVSDDVGGRRVAWPAAARRRALRAVRRGAPAPLRDTDQYPIAAQQTGRLSTAGALMQGSV